MSTVNETRVIHRRGSLHPSHFTSTLQLSEYEWPINSNKFYFLEEHIARYLNIKSFHRKFEDLERRDIDLPEKERLLELGLINEIEMRFRLVALKFKQILEFMRENANDKYHQFVVSVKNRINSDVNKNKKNSEIINNADFYKSAIIATARYNHNLNIERNSRFFSFDTQTHVLHYPRDEITKNHTQIDTYFENYIENNIIDSNLLSNNEYYNKYNNFNDILYKNYNYDKFGAIYNDLTDLINKYCNYNNNNENNIFSMIKNEYNDSCNDIINCNNIENNINDDKIHIDNFCGCNDSSCLNKSNNIKESIDSIESNDSNIYNKYDNFYKNHRLNDIPPINKIVFKTMAEIDQFPITLIPGQFQSNIPKFSSDDLNLFLANKDEISEDDNYIVTRRGRRSRGTPKSTPRSTPRGVKKGTFRGRPRGTQRGARSGSGRGRWQYRVGKKIKRRRSLKKILDSSFENESISYLNNSNFSNLNNIDNNLDNNNNENNIDNVDNNNSQEINNELNIPVVKNKRGKKSLLPPNSDLICAECNVPDTNIDNMLTCNKCNKKYHPFCMDVSRRLIEQVKSNGWCCYYCKTCEICLIPNSDNLLLCDYCDRPYHIECLNLKEVPLGRWICEKCGGCSSCLKTQVPSNGWLEERIEQDGESKLIQIHCIRCSKKFKDELYCCVCFEALFTRMQISTSITCIQCEKRVHPECLMLDSNLCLVCAGLSNKRF